jgi:hypothetical protein
MVGDAFINIREAKGQGFSVPLEDIESIAFGEKT